MTHAYYDEIHVTDTAGKAIPLSRDSGPGGPVGWMSTKLGPDAMRSVGGLSIVIGDVPDAKTGAALALAIGQQGNIRTESVRAFNEDEYKEIVGALP